MHGKMRLEIRRIKSGGLVIAKHGGIVDEKINGADSVDGFFDEKGCLSDVLKVGLNGDGLATSVTNFRRQFLRRIQRAVRVNGNAKALFSQIQSYPPTDTIGAAGDQRGSRYSLVFPRGQVALPWLFHLVWMHISAPRRDGREMGQRNVKIYTGDLCQ